MNKRILAGVALLAAIAVALYLWKGRGGDDDAPAATDEVTEDGEPTPTRMTADEGSPAAAAAQPTVYYDDDPEGPLRLEGQVLDMSDVPVAGAVVTLSSRPPRTAVSESDGSFVFDELVGRTYSLSARKDEVVGGPVMHELTPDSDPVAIRVRQGASVEVTVIGGDTGKPIAGAYVQLRATDRQEATTGDDGTVSFRGVAPGWFSVVAHADGYARAHQAVQVADTPGIRATARVVLQAGAPVAGRVVDEAGAPVAGARVLPHDVSALYSLQDPAEDAALTDDDGAFRFDAIAAGSYRFLAIHPEYVRSSSDTVQLDGRVGRDDVTIVVARGGTLTGKVVDTRGAAVPWATVRVRTKQVGLMGIPGDPGLREATALEDGTFELKALPRAVLELMARSEQASSEAIEVDMTAKERVTGVVLTLDVEGRIAGVVVDSDGEPVPEAQVTALPDFFGADSQQAVSELALRGMAAETTDGGGRFAFTGLPDGTYRLRAARASVNQWQWMQRGEQAATGDEDVRLVLLKDGAVKGKVAFEDGSASELFTVTVGFPPGTPVSDPDGAFEIAAVPPGTYDVTVRGADFADVTVRDVQVSPSKTTDVGTIRAAKGRAVSGRIVDLQGRPVVGATVVTATRLIGDGRSAVAELGAGADEAMGLRRATSGDDGHYRIRGIGKGEITLGAEHADRGRAVPTLLPPGTEDLTADLTLQPFGTVVGRVLVGDKPAPGAQVAATPQGGSSNMTLVVTTGDDGGFVFDRLGEGPHRLMANLPSAGGFSANTAGRDVIVQAGEEVRADIVVEVGEITLKVTIEGAGGATIDAAQVFLFDSRTQPTNAQEVQDAFLASSQTGSAFAAFSFGGQPATFEKIRPGNYSLCTLPINGDMNDPSFQQRLQKHALSLKVYCKAVAVEESPAEQAVSHEVPPMTPLPDEG